MKPKRKRRKSQTQDTKSLLTQLTFYCPECGEGPIRWQGHYVCCPNCLYDAFVL